MIIPLIQQEQESHRHGEHRLIAAVIIGAIKDLRPVGVKMDRGTKALRVMPYENMRSSVEFFGGDGLDIFCEHLGYDPQILRDEVESMIAAARRLMAYHGQPYDKAVAAAKKALTKARAKTMMVDLLEIA